MSRFEPKKMLVWDDDVDRTAVKRIVLWVGTNGRCVAVAEDTEIAYENGDMFHLIPWDHCREIGARC